ncbi:GGDEF domain-containing protein [Gayadomonas joobiniege]|uniref:GGDEF domain-containing protein n=1 Tax=Gayadomonas joobiniege TaxID=1234606 RepID=UPI000368FC7A|nr:diguanylate cyclase [Gayadomonas joobiniege]
MGAIFKSIFCGFFILFSSLTVAKSEVKLLDEGLVVADDNLWRLVDSTQPVNSNNIHLVYKQATPKTTLLAESGAVISKIPISASNKSTWYILPIANFVDKGQAFWQSTDGAVRQIADFSQLHTDSFTPILAHGQAFKLEVDKNTQGILWLYLKAEYYPMPVSLQIETEQAFFYHSFILNTVSVAALAVMFAMALIALIMYLKTRHKVALFCVGYVGIHALGWLLASGFGQIWPRFSSFNTSYLGMYLFPWAIGCAAYFAYYLFNFDRDKTLKNANLKYFANTALLSGCLIWLLPFKFAFYLSHAFAAIWIPLSLLLAYKMLSVNDFRAKYFFIGNLMYSLSLAAYMHAHSVHADAGTPELYVMVALAVDCICILLSLSEWLRIKQLELKNTIYQSRYDALTKVGNRFLLNEDLKNLNGSYLVVFIDCDGIKKLNDRYGHARGDQYLISVANTMQAQLGEIGEVYRTGGDEFIWLCPVNKNQRSSTTSKLEIERILQRTDSFIVASWPDSGISYGIASSEETNSPSECVSLADKRMYQLKFKRKSLKIEDNFQTD